MKFFSKKRFSKGWFTGVVLGIATSATLVYAAFVNVPIGGICTRSAPGE